MAAQNGRKVRWEWIAGGAIAVAIFAVVAFAVFQPIKVLPRLRLAPGFLLTDQDGKRFSNEDLRGKIVLYSFSYSHCGARCDSTHALLRAVQAGLLQVEAGGAPVELVTITLDPEHDTPEALGAYARSVGADANLWRWAAADPKRTKDIVGGGLEVFYEPDGQGGFNFAPAFALVDGWGIIRSEYRNQVPPAEAVLQHIGVVEDEVRKSRGVAKVAYEAAHLFACYAP